MSLLESISATSRDLLTSPISRSDEPRPTDDSAIPGDSSVCTSPVAAEALNH